MSTLPSRNVAPHARVYGPPPGRRPPARSKRRAGRGPQRTLSALGAVIIVSIIGLSAFFVVAEERRGHRGSTAAPPASTPVVGSRTSDPAPLTQSEVFPRSEVRPAPGTAPYRITMSHSDSECRIATTGDLGALLADHGCDQVVRAGLTAPGSGYRVTAGIFNLADEDGAALVSAVTGTLVESGRGGFPTLGGLPGDPLAEPPVQVTWQHRGHFLLYCVVARPDGQLVADDDPYAAQISTDLVERYLADQVVGRRALHP